MEFSFHNINIIHYYAIVVLLLRVFNSKIVTFYTFDHYEDIFLQATRCQHCTFPVLGLERKFVSRQECDHAGAQH